MKKSLALFLAIILCVSGLFVGCGNESTNKDETESGTQAGGSTEKVVELKELYVKGKYEGTDLSSYLTLGDYTGIITVKESDYVVTDADIQAEIDKYKAAYGTPEEVKDRDVVQNGDIVNIDYVGRIDGIKFEGGSAEKQDLEIGSGTFIDGFESGLIGAKKGDTVDVETTFPADYKANPELSGKKAIFTVTIHKISAIVPAEYNDALVSEITNKVYTTVAEFNQYIKTQLEVSKKSKVLNTFIEELAKKSVFTDKTNELINKKYEEVVEYYESYATMYGFTLEKFALAMGYASEKALLDELKGDATEEAHHELIMYAYGNAIGFELTDDAALAILDDLVLLQGAESREDVLTNFGAETVRIECYGEALADAVINNYK